VGRTERHIREHESNSRELAEDRLQSAVYRGVCSDMALFDVSDLEEAAVLGKVGGTAGALSPRVEGVAEAPPASRLDSRGECGGDVVGKSTGSGDEGFKTRPKNFNYDRDTHGAKSR